MLRKSFSLEVPGPIRTIIPVSTMSGDEVEVTTEHDGHGGWTTEAIRRYRHSPDGVIIVVEESEPLLVKNSPPHGNEMNKGAAHAHGLEELIAYAPINKDFRALFLQGRIGAPGEAEEMERVSHLSAQEAFDREDFEDIRWDDEL